MIKTYILLDPFFNKRKGITVYTEKMLRLLSCRRADILCILYKNTRNETFDTFYKTVKEEISKRFKVGEYVVELPEAHCEFYNIDKGEIIHIRLHGLDFLLRYAQRLSFDQNRLANELAQIKKASFISLPSSSFKQKIGNFLAFSRAYIYPNPIDKPKELTFIERPIPFAYIGVNSKLKGFKKLYLLSVLLFKRIPVITDKVSFIDRLFVKKVRELDKEKFLPQVKFIFVLSYIESFSYVLYEALNNGCKVITWGDIPLPSKMSDRIIQLPSRNLIDLFFKLRNLAFDYRGTREYENLYRSYEKEILTNINIFVTNKDNSHSSLSNINLKAIKECSMVKNNSTYRKLRKLFTKPKQYWRDSKMRKFFKPDIVTHENKPNIAEHENKPDIAKHENKSGIVTHEKKQTSSKENDFDDLYHLQKTPLQKDNLLFVLQTEEDISLLNLLKGCKGITQFSLKNLAVVKYRGEFGFRESSEILDHLEFETIQVLQTFKFVFFVNPPINIIEAIRCCSRKVRIFTIITDSTKLKQISPNVTDVLLSNELPENPHKYRVFVKLSSENLCSKENISIIRQVLREQSSKDPNFFIPLLGEPKLLDDGITTSKSSIYMVIEKNIIGNPDALTFDDIIHQLHLKNLYIREEDWFRYKTVVCHAQQKNDYSTLLDYMLDDGAFVNVKN